MVVVDTGSTDGTIHIAETFGARVYHFPWCDDFAAARNASLMPATGEWIFWMDSDDTIPESSGRRLRQLADATHSENVLGYVMQVHCPGPVGNAAPDLTVVDHVKMFRNLSAIRFEGRIHEQVLPAIRRSNGEVTWTDIFVVHSGSDQSPEGRKRKQHRDLRLLRLELGDSPDHPFALFNLGMTYADMDEHNLAIDALRRCLSVSSPGESHVRKAFALLAASQTRLTKHAEAWETCERGLAVCPKDSELLFRKGLVAHALHRFDEAVAAYRAALSEESERHFASVDPAVAGYKARHNMALVYADVGRHALAELEWRRILLELPDYRPAWLGLGESLIRQAKHVSAAIAADSMAARELLRCDAHILKAEIAVACGESNNATRELEGAIKDFPDSLDLLRARGRLLFESGAAEDARFALETLTKREPRDPSAWHNLGTIHLRLDRFDSAADCFRRSLELRPHWPATEQQLAFALRQLGGAAG
jgi:tetratricopeptide (TPR) repeat protein